MVLSYKVESYKVDYSPSTVGVELFGKVICYPISRRRQIEVAPATGGIDRALLEKMICFSQNVGATP
jgi:hypothetical protein